MQNSVKGSVFYETRYSNCDRRCPGNVHCPEQCCPSRPKAVEPSIHERSQRRHHDGRNDHHDGYHDGHHDHHHDGDSCGNDSCHHHGDCDNGDGWNTIHPIPAPKPIIHRFPVGTIYRLNQTTATGRFKQLGLLNTKLLVGRPPNTTNGTIPTLGESATAWQTKLVARSATWPEINDVGRINTAGSVVSDVGNGLEGFASGLLTRLIIRNEGSSVTSRTPGRFPANRPGVFLFQPCLVVSVS